MLPDDPRYQELTVGYNQRFVGSPDYVRIVGIVTRFWFRTPGSTGAEPGRQLMAPPKDVRWSAVGIPRSLLDKAKFGTLVANWCGWYQRNSAPTSPGRCWTPTSPR